MTVKVEGRRVHRGEPVESGSMFDNNVETLEFEGLPEFHSDQVVSIHWRTLDGVSYGNVDMLTKTENGYEYPISAEMSARSKVIAFIRITDGNDIWNTEFFTISLNPLPFIDGSLPGIPDTNVIQQALNIINKGIEDADTATASANAAATLANNAAASVSAAIELANTAAASAASAASSALDAAGAALTAASAGVRTDVQQDLTAAQQAQARSNIGLAATDSNGDGNVVFG